MKVKAMLVLFAAMLTLSACGGDQIEPNMSETVPDFEFTTQDEEPLGLQDLKGDWWIAFFSYTHCTTVCPRTTANMIRVQKELKTEGFTPEIVSFNIDPDNDTPEALRTYAAEYGADLNTFNFLTGYDFETIRDLSVGTFKAVLEKGAMGQRSHSYYFYLINPDGEIVKKYDGMSEQENDWLIEDVQTVL